jgi:hypothetical protein
MAIYVDDSGNLVDSLAPVPYDEQVASLLQMGTPPDQIQGLIGTKESFNQGLKAQAEEVYQRTGEVPSYAESVGYVAPPPAWLNPQDYTSSGYAAPYTQAEITGQVNPSNYRIGSNGQLYASAKGAGDLSGGEYLIDPNTGKFKLDASGKPFGVTYAKPKNFDDWLTTTEGQLAVLSLPALAAAGAAAAGAYGAGGAGGFGLTGASGAGGAMGAGSALQLAPAATIGGYGSIAAPSLATGLGVGAGGVLGAGALSAETVALMEAMKAGTGYGLNASQVPNLAQGLELGTTGTGIDNLLSSLGSALKTPLGQLATRGGLSLLSGGGQQTAVPQMAGGSGTYAPKGQVDYTPILNLLAPRQIARNTNSLLG